MKRRAADSSRAPTRTGRRDSVLSIGPRSNAMLMGTRCMACDRPVRIRQSIAQASKPRLPHNAFQPYAPMQVQEGKRTNHAFPGSNRAMTESPTLEDRSGASDIRATPSVVKGGRPVAKRWYDDGAAADIPVVEMSAPEVGLACFTLLADKLNGLTPAHMVTCSPDLHALIV